MKLRISGMTDPGRQRERNEDAVAWSEQQGYAILADGVGGQNAGDVASRMVVAILEERLRDAEQADAEASLAAAVETANRRVYAEAHANPLHHGMGSTVVAVRFEPTAVVVAHVGDSRLYRWRAGVLEQLTCDHSLVQELMTAGVLSPQQGQTSSFGNIITRALGSSPEVLVDVARHPLRRGDRVLLCSDGLSDLVPDNEIAAILARAGTPEDAARDLVALANAQGGTDNISVIVAEISE
jgi:protein phosphatase